MSVPPLGMHRSPLDSTLLSLGEDGLSFFQAQTGIEDVEQLRQHILQVQAEAYEAYPYPCIRRFLFTQLRIAKSPNYEHVLRLGKSRDNAVFLDVGCCFGHDIRAVVADGYPLQNIVGLDLRRGLWDFGYKLFKSTPTNFPVPFVEGDIFDPAILDMSVSSSPNLPAPPLHRLGNSLTGLRSHVSVIHATMFFHLFSEGEQQGIAQRLGALLSPLPGSIIFGHHIGLVAPGIHPSNPSGKRMFCHSPESWRTMWNSVGFENGSIEVNVELVQADAIQFSKSEREESSEFYGRDSDERHRSTKWLSWSIKRI